MEIFIGYVLKGILLPPGINLLAVAFAYVLPRRWHLRRLLLLAAWLSLWVLSMPLGAGALASLLEIHPVVDERATAAQAIVILGGGREQEAPEYHGRDSLARDTLERVRYGAYLARQLDLPVAVSGGTVLDDERQAIGTIMAEVLRQEFGTEVTWVEDASRNTAQNATMSRALLPHDKIVLVTHALHMRRAVAAFESAGFEVFAAPLAFESGGEFDPSIFSFLPSAGALKLSRDALHELLGIVYYAMRY